jgi:DNA-binding MarR family transcriptional regulator
MTVSYSRLKPKQKRAILILHDSGEWNGREIAELFGITPGRVSQLVRNIYGEREALGIDKGEFSE